MLPSPPPARGRLRLSTPDEWRPAVTRALGVAGVDSDPRAALGVAVVPARTVRPEVDEWTVDSRPHLLVAVWAHGLEVGPWVLPGAGPCARCVAADTLDDTGRGLPPTIEPDPALLAQAAGWVTRDALRWLRGERPLTWQASWLLSAAPIPDERRWRRHPYCGCGWWESA